MERRTTTTNNKTSRPSKNKFNGANESDEFRAGGGSLNDAISVSSTESLDDALKRQYRYSTEVIIYPRIEGPRLNSKKMFVLCWDEVQGAHNTSVQPPADIRPDLFRKWKAESKLPIEQVDSSAIVKKANHALENSNQSKAQYGTLLPEGVEQLVEKLDIKENDIFLDVGSGTGQVLCQVASTTSCRAAMGIEIDPERCDVSFFYKEWFENYLHVTSKGRLARMVQTVEFFRKCVDIRQGDLTDPAYNNLLRSATVIYCNNFNGIFGVRTETASGNTLDFHLASIFAGTKPGTRLVSFESLNDHLGDDVALLNNKILDMHRGTGFEKTRDATFFTYEKIELGSLRLTSWGCDGKKRLYVHLYTRTEQSHPHPLWIGCRNTECEGQTHPTAALDEETNLLHRRCVYCEEMMRMSTTRSVRQKR